METEAWEQQLARIHFSHVLIVLLVTGYIFQRDFRNDLNSFLTTTIETGTDLIPLLLKAEHPLVILLVFGVVASALFVIYIIIKYR